MTAKSRSKSSRLTFLRLAYSAPASDDSTSDEIRRLTQPATKALPFVKLRAHDQPMWRPESYWRAIVTGKRQVDVQLGRAYARRAVAAMKADRNGDLIALILQDIIKDGVQRMSKTGHGRLCPIALGFMREISEALAER